MNLRHGFATAGSLALLPVALAAAEACSSSSGGNNNGSPDAAGPDGTTVAVDASNVGDGGSASSDAEGGSTTSDAGDGGVGASAIMVVPDDMAGLVYRYAITAAADPTPLGSVTVPTASSVALRGTGEAFVTGFSTQTISRFLSPLGTPTANGTIANVGLSGLAEASVFVDDELWIANYGGSQLVRVKFDAQGAASAAGTVSNVSMCEGLYWDAASRTLYVSEAYSAGTRVQRFQVAADHSTTPLADILTPNPYAVVVTPWSELFMSDYRANSINRYTIDAQGNATKTGTITGNALSNPVAFAFAPWGELFVGNQGTGSVSRFTFDSAHAAVAHGTFKTQAGPAPNGAGNGSRMDWVSIF